ncbi:MAG TPA: carboxypeptidase regulatory-like domain-containing protein [Blastocatellia bacterium]|nr:carboxypeptidase regulatory-like domain-containing protein [Blastocatellia bacterium]
MRGISLSVALFALNLTAVSQGSQPAQKEASGTVTGRLKIEDQPARGFVVALSSADYNGSATNAITKATTDDDGRYQLTGVAAGRFRVMPLAPGYVVYNTGLARTDSQVVTLGDGEVRDGIDFTLVRGGVITGRVTSAEGRAVIGERVNVTSVDANTQAGQRSQPPAPPDVNFTTDDRGVYRVYGLPAGRYLVSVGRGGGGNRGQNVIQNGVQQNGGQGATPNGGQGGTQPGAQNGGPGGGGPGGGGPGGRGPGGGPGGPGGFGGFGPFGPAAGGYQLTYYPDATDQAQATIVEVEAGKEASGINIRMAGRGEVFAASGRVIDAETGRPVVGVLVGHGMANRRSVMGNITDGVTNENGEFRIEGLRAGAYAAFAAQDPAAGLTDFYSDPATFEVVTQDASGLEVKLHRAASISGTIVFEGQADPAITTNLQNLIINASVRGSGLNVMNDLSVNAAPNGSFRLTGLSPGRVNLNVSNSQAPGPFSGITLLRIERNGADARAGLEVAAGEQVAGVRVVLATGSSIVRGTVKVEGGTMSQGMMMMVMARRTDDGSGAGGGMRGGMSAAPSPVDPSGRFQIEKLVAGTYEISVQVMGGGGGGPGQRQQRPSSATQTVAVGNGTTQDVVLTLNLADLNTQGGSQRNPGGNPQGNPGQGRPGRQRP